MTQQFFDPAIFDLEDLYNPLLTKFYSIYWDVSFIITTLFFVIMVYVIITKSSKEMGSYKLYLCHQLGWSYAYDLHMGLWKPVPLWPFYVGYSAGIYRSFQSSYVPMVLMVFTSVGLGFSIYISVLHRYLHAAPLSTFYRFYNIIWFRLLHYIIIFISMQVIICGPMIYFIPDMNNLKKSLVDQNQNFQEIINLEPSLFGYDRKQNNSVFLLVMTGIIITFLLTIVSIVFLYFNFIRIIRKNRNFLCPTTLKLQTFLFRALCIQMFLGVILLILPMTTAITLSIFGFKWVPKFSMLAIMITATHTLSDFSAIIYSVKVYRLFFYEIYLKLLKKVGIKVVERSISSTIFAYTVSAAVSPTIQEK